MQAVGSGAKSVRQLARILQRPSYDPTLERVLMFAAKSLITLFAIAAGGYLNAGLGGPRPAAASTPAVATSLAAEPAGPTGANLQAAAEKAVLAQIREDLKDDEARVRLAVLSFERTSSRSIEGRGRGAVLFDSGDSVPVEVTVTYDLPEARVERTDYLIAGSGSPLEAAALGPGLRENIADRIGARLVLEFSQQKVDFSLLALNALAAGRNRIMISGNGITRFQGEGAAYTRFVATADKLSGRILTIQYELLQELEGSAGTALAASN